MRKMMPIGPLMIEHRLIERMIAVMRKEVDRMEREGKADPPFIETIVDFIRVYADRCHHGKEDKSFFPPVMTYFTPEEKQAMLEEEFEFDRGLIRERYRQAAERAEARFGREGGE